LQSEVYLKPLDPSDETIEQIATRMKNFLTEILHNYAGKHIVACSHGDPIMILRTVIENKPLEFYSFKTSPYIKHGEIYQITADENTLSVTSIFKPIREG
jgi:broad specificity phosphatase PhoE